MRDSYYLPWDASVVRDGDGISVDYDDEGNDAVRYLACKVAENSAYTADQAAEKLYRLIGWLCK